MPTLKEQLQTKVDALGIGNIQSSSSYLSTTESKPSTIGVAEVILNDPRIYKPIFSLDKLKVDKTIKSVVVEVKDSILRFYYILDSSCYFFDFQCNYQTLEAITELPVEVIHYLRILCSKKGRLYLIVRSEGLYILFYDTFPSKMPAKERKNKEIERYVLQVPLLNKEVDKLDLAVIEFVKEVVDIEDKTPISNKSITLPLDLSSITYNKEPLEYLTYSVPTKKGDLVVIDTSGICSTLVICPVLTSSRGKNDVSNLDIVVQDINDDEYNLDTESLDDLEDSCEIN